MGGSLFITPHARVKRNGGKALIEAPDEVDGEKGLVKVVMGHVDREVEGHMLAKLEGETVLAAPDEALLLACAIGRSGVIAYHDAGVEKHLEEGSTDGEANLRNGKRANGVY